MNVPRRRRVGALAGLVVMSLVLLQACDVGGFTLADVTETLTITNASADQAAVVLVTFSDASSDFRLAAGASKTATVVGATDYTVEVLAPDLAAGASYQAQLLQMRSELIDLSINPGDSGATFESALAQIPAVDAALAQLHGSKTSQSCGHAAVLGGRNRVTMTWTTPGVGGLWDLSCT
jgi:hypothetical protein